MNLLIQQQEAKQHLLPRKVGALLMDAGTGKTRTAIELINSVDEVTEIFWFGPLQTLNDSRSSVIQEINKWGGLLKPINYIGIESIGQSDRIYLEICSKIQNSKVPFLIVDESLKIKNADAKRTKRMLEFSRMAEYKLILNGTPITRDLLDLWSQLEFLSPLILNMRLAEFKNTFCYYTKIKKFIGRRQSPYEREFITGYENIDYLYSLIHPYIFEANLKLDLQQQYFEFNYLIDEQTKKEYELIKVKILDNEKLLAMNNNIFIEITQKLQHLYSTTEDKFTICNNLFKTIPQNKTIIFCKYISSRIECQKRYPNALVLSYQKNSLGLNLQEYNHTIYFDKNWDYGYREHSKARTFRTGQTSICRYYDLTGDAGLEQLINKNIERKNNMVSQFKTKSNGN